MHTAIHPVSLRLTRRTTPWLIALVAALCALTQAAPGRAQPPAAQPAPTAPALDPAHTWVFAVGLLTWRAPDEYPGFEQDDRHDARLIEAFRARAVPDSQIVFLTDRRATRARIVRALGALLARTGPGDTLWFFHDGHGVQDDEGRTYLVPWDATDDLATTALAVPDLVAAIDRGFHGARVILASDACHSGALADEVRARRSRIAYAALTAVLTDGTSPDSWTFTDAMIDVVRGARWLDADRDGRLTLREAARGALRRIRLREDEQGDFAASPGFALDTVLAPAAPR